MPFSWHGTPDAGPSTSTLRVEPDQVLQLKAELQSIRDEVETFLNTKGRAMVMQPLGADPVSYETAYVFNENAQAAHKVAWGYVDELTAVLNALDMAVNTYNLVDDTHAAHMQALRQALQ